MIQVEELFYCNNCKEDAIAEFTIYLEEVSNSSCGLYVKIDIEANCRKCGKYLWGGTIDDNLPL